MSKRQLLILLGIWNMVFLFISFPAALDKVFALASGAIIIIVAFALKPKNKDLPKGVVPFVEHRTPQSDQAPAYINSTDSRMSS